MTFNPFQENTYVLYDESGSCIIVDPGCYEPDERHELQAFISNNDLRVTQLVNTHCHIDHVLGNEFVRQTYGVGLHIHKLEEPVLRAVGSYAPNYGFNMYQPASVDGYLEEGGELLVGNVRLSILFVPGHAPGHIAFYDSESKSLISGDVLFYNSIGRTDLPGGNFEVLENSIRKKLYALPDDTTVYPGHGPKTTIGFEKKTNPFVHA
ncbi:MBL fold metallo-hydrolase [Chryseolinea sp. T2]|uniref:MBL fold metallo-hydrolase n=1 Tax=Chryseolinea sp. T2 TaxID=3129255 RepID=UPI0030785D76